MIDSGTIVLLKFPFSDRIGFKRRPALILKDFEDGDLLVCRITSKIYKSKYDIYLDNWLHFGLKLPSVIRVHKMATLESDMIESTMGCLDDITFNKIMRVYLSIIDN